MDTAQIYTPTWQERLGRRFFPQAICHTPEVHGAKDCVVITTTATLSFTGRLRALVSGRIQVETRTATECKVGRVLTLSATTVLPPRWMERREKGGEK